MANSNNVSDKSPNDSMVSQIFDCQLDLDYNDEEFRAGYPFSNIPAVECDGSVFNRG